MATVNGAPLSFEAVIESNDFEKALDRMVAKTMKLAQEQQKAAEAGIQGQKEQVRQNQALQKSVLQLQIQMDSYRAIVAKSTDPAVIAKYNGEIRKIEQTIKQIGSIGSKGFDAMGRPLKEQLSVLGKLEKAAKLYQDAISKATSEQNIIKYNKKLEETNKEINRLKNAGRSGFDAMGNQIQANTGLLEKFKGGLLGIASVFGVAFGVTQLIAWGKELFNIAAKAEGIELAFSRLGQPGLLDNLRAATRGTVDDLTLMKTAVKASDFKIPMDTLGKGLAFAQQKAKDTGQDIDYMVESLITGIGRKSLPILDNLNLSSQEIQQEFQKTGDFAQAVGNIIEREMARSGKAVDTLSEKSGGAATVWANLKTEIAGFFRTALDPGALNTDKITEITGTIVKSFGEATKMSSDQLNNGVAELKKERDKLEKKRLELDAKFKGLKYDALYNEKADRIMRQDVALREELQAVNNVLSVYQKQTVTLANNERISRNILSVAELQAKAESLRTKAMEIIPTTSEDKKNRANLLKEAEEIQKEIDKILGKSDKNRDKKASADAERMIRQREALLRQLQGLEEEYGRKGMTREKAEEQAILDKFKRLKSEINEFNKSKGAVAIDVALLEPMQEKAINDLRYSQETEKLNISLEQQKQLYIQHEAFKKEYGEKAATERFQHDIDLSKTYLDVIQEQLNEVRAIPADQLTDMNQERYIKLLKDEEEEKKRIRNSALDENIKGFARLLDATKNAADERLKVEEKYLKDLALLESSLAGPDNEAELNRRKAVLGERKQQEIDSVNDGYAAKMEAFKRLFNGITDLSDSAAKEVIADAEAMLNALVASGKISAEFADKIRKNLKEAGNSLKDRFPQRLANLSAEMRNLAGAVSTVDEQFSRILGTTANVIGNVVQIKDSMDAMKKANADKDLLGGITAGLGIFGAVTSIMQTIVDIGNRPQQERRAREDAQQSYQQQMQIKAIEGVTRAVERQLALIKELYGTERLVEYRKSLTQIRLEMEKQYGQLADAGPVANPKEGLTGEVLLLTGDKRVDEVIAKLNKGQGVYFAELERVREWIAKNGPLQTLDPLIKALENDDTSLQAMADLRKLLDEGKLDEVTAAMVENLLALQEQFKDTLNAIRAEVTGTSIESLADDLVELFARGNAAAADFAENFEEIMKRSILNSFKRNALEKELQEFYADFAEYAETGGSLSDLEIATLRAEYDRIIKSAEEKFQELAKVTGVSFAPEADSSGQTGLAGAIRGMTEQQADLLAGQFGAVRLHLAELVGMKRQEMGLDTDNSFLLQQSFSLKEQTRLATESLQVHLRMDQKLGEIVLSSADSVNKLSQVVQAQGEQVRSLRSIDNKMSSTNEILRANGG
ncbi:hypothetical protein Q4E40_02560 [Pontibacter sp. BT731]|uniref:hypothetical protein n=1 Tax=Pontibacter coccineus TaxID=3063328 RepID=UPI0026E44E5D|nr:hypothetical protein [Pontibacter sp. BT731]MDO6388994.1 hypothetical protein [Pontibacter sp. BT731]